MVPDDYSCLRRFSASKCTELSHRLHQFPIALYHHRPRIVVGTDCSITGKGIAGGGFCPLVGNLYVGYQKEARFKSVGEFGNIILRSTQEDRKNQGQRTSRRYRARKGREKERY